VDLERSGNDESALKYLMQAVIIAPKYAKAFFEMGNCLARLGRFREAREKYDRASHIDPGLPEGMPKDPSGINPSTGKR
jgi:tetratricopeptide (TPR) repeat protein